MIELSIGWVPGGYAVPAGESWIIVLGPDRGQLRPEPEILDPTPAVLIPDVGIFWKGRPLDGSKSPGRRRRRC